MEYRKLVRDRIPEIIRHRGQECDVATLTEEEYRRALREKLVEEAREVELADGPALLSELADVYEVLAALIAAEGMEEVTVRAEQDRRRAERGGFASRTQLLRVR